VATASGDWAQARSRGGDFFSVMCPRGRCALSTARYLRSRSA